MTPREKQLNLAKVNPTVKVSTAALVFDQGNQEPGPSSTPDENCTIGHFEDASLPECLRGSWVNASGIVDLEGTTSHPNGPNKRVVIFLSGPTTHIVEISKNCKKLTCDAH